MFFPSLCRRCLRCLPVCPTGAGRASGDRVIVIGRDRCRACGACAAACGTGARAIAGRSVTVGEVMGVIRKDALFYRNSGGGVTLSGGEPSSQPRFAAAVLRACREQGFHAALDTCGHVPWETLESLLPQLDLLLYDLKHMDPVKHRELTRADNSLILENFKRIARCRKKVIVRVP